MERKIVREEEVAWGPHWSYPRVQTKLMLGKADQPEFSVHRVRLEPGAEISLHIHQPSAETFYIISGTGLCLSQGGEVPFGPGFLGLAPSGYVHGLRNNGTEPVELLAIFSPPTA